MKKKVFHGAKCLLMTIFSAWNSLRVKWEFSLFLMKNVKCQREAMTVCFLKCTIHYLEMNIILDQEQLVASLVLLTTPEMLCMTSNASWIRIEIPLLKRLLNCSMTQRYFMNVDL